MKKTDMRGTGGDGEDAKGTGDAALERADNARAVRAALGWMVVSCLMFALVMVSIRLFLVDLPSEQSVFLRYLIGALMLLPVIGRSATRIVTSPVRGLMGVRALLHGLAVYTWFFGVLRIPLAEVNAMLNLGPVYATIGAALFMGERLRIRRIAAIGISFVGALIIIKPGFAEINLGTIAILVTAPLFAASDLIAKRLKAFDDDKMIIFSLSVGIAAFMMIPAIGVWQPITPTNWIGIMAISIAATLGHITLMRSFSGPMWAAQTGKYMQLLFVVLFGIALFDEIPALSTLLGALVVLAAVSYIPVPEGRSREAGP
jgi:drug/metabolite transporter (DMT)-like permease